MERITINSQDDYNSKITFGKWKGKTYQWIINNDNQYWRWMIKEKIAKDKLKERGAIRVRTISDVAKEIKADLMKELEVSRYYDLKKLKGVLWIYRRVRKKMGQKMWRVYVKYRKLTPNHLVSDSVKICMLTLKTVNLPHEE